MNVCDWFYYGTFVISNHGCVNLLCVITGLISTILSLTIQASLLSSSTTSSQQQMKDEATTSPALTFEAACLDEVVNYSMLLMSLFIFIADAP
jgi:hypothetical protein